MANTTTTILQQILHLLPEDQFESFVGQHRADRYVKKLTCWNQLTILLYAQASGKDSLRDIETGLLASGNRWYHLGLETAAKSTLARANEKRPYQIYESLFYEMIGKCGNLGSGTALFSFKNDLYALDSTTIDLCLSLFPWAKFRTAKGAIKLHTLFNVRSQIPELIRLTDGKTNDIPPAHEIDFGNFPKGAIFVFDRGYNDYSLLRKIKDAGHHFVIRMKKNTHIFRILGHERAVHGKGVLADETVAFALEEAQESYPDNLRLVTYHDDEHNETYQFLTDEFRLSAVNIALVYKNRWQIELFFKWIKQHLQIKTFLGTSKNAVLTQIWIAMIYYLLLAWIKFQTKFKGSLHVLTVMVREVCLQPVQIINLLRLNLRTLRKALPRDAPQLSFF
jgi:hypothetical protein